MRVVGRRRAFQTRDRCDVARGRERPRRRRRAVGTRRLCFRLASGGGEQKSLAVRQPRALAPYNWLLNAGEHPDGEPRRFCPIQRHLVGQSDYAQSHVDPGRLWGRAYLPRAVLEPSPPTEAQEAAYAQMSDAQLQAQDAALDELEREVCPVDHLQLMRTEQMVSLTLLTLSLTLTLALTLT